METRPLAEMAQVNRASLGARDKPEEIQYIDIASVETGVVLRATKMPYADAPGGVCYAAWCNMVM